MIVSIRKIRFKGAIIIITNNNNNNDDDDNINSLKIIIETIIKYNLCLGKTFIYTWIS